MSYFSSSSIICNTLVSFSVSLFNLLSPGILGVAKKARFFLSKDLSFNSKTYVCPLNKVNGGQSTLFIWNLSPVP